MPVYSGDLGKAPQMRVLVTLIHAIASALLSMAKWALPVAFIGLVYLSVVEMKSIGTGIRNLFSWSQPKVPAKPLPERVATAKDRCRADTYVVDFNGSKNRLEPDKVRVMCTLIRLEETGVDPCDIFAIHMELVPPGWGRRTMKPYNPILKRGTYVPKRRDWYVKTKSTPAEYDAALLLGIRTKDQKLCPADWKATTLIRPDSDDTLAANQSAEEIAAIRKMVRQNISGPPSEFEFYYKAP